METLAKYGLTHTNRVENAVKQLQAGKGILLVDDENRENEADLIYPANTMTYKDMALMIRHCSGIVCLCLTPEKCKELELTPMVKDNTSKNQTAFTISIEAKEGVTTGVSAKDRIQTIKTAVKTNAKPEDLAHPGHIFPLMARKNGVFERRGHTEASIDLVKIAGLGNSSVLCELTNEDGTMARLNHAIEFAEMHNMLILSVEDIYKYRQEKE